MPHVELAHTRRLTAFYTIALSLVAALSILGQVLVQRELQRQKTDSHVVNIAGRQRMLSQKISKAALALQTAKTDDERTRRLDELRAVRLLWTESHERLQRGDLALGLPGANSAAVEQMFAQLEPHFLAMLAGVAGLLDGATPDEPTSRTQIAANVAKILAHEDDYLQGMDAVVFQYDREAEDRVAHLRTLEISLLALTLLVLSAEGAFIFRPAVRKIRAALSALEQSNDALAVAKEAAESASRAKSQFLANVSHEIRTPMTAVIGLTDVVLESELSPEQRSHLESVKSSADRLMGLLNETLDLAKIEAGKLELDPQPFDLRATLPAALAPLAAMARNKGLEFHLEIAPQVPRHVIGDSQRLSQIVINLAGNAVKFTNSGAVRVVVGEQSGTSDERVISLAVSDTGIGIPAEKQDLIFTAFTQADSSTTRKYGGTGLGLSIAAELVSLMGGHLRVASEPGHGTTFTCDLHFGVCSTIVDEQVVQPTVNVTPTTASVESRPLHVLLVDDTEANRQFVTAILEARGHSVVATACGSEALSAIGRQPFDVALMDVRMPDRDGLETTVEIRQHERRQGARHLPIVALTADCLSDARRRCLDAGMDDYLAKPFPLPTLIQRVEYWGSTVQDGCKSQDAGQIATAPLVDIETALARLEGNVALWHGLIRLFQTDGPHLLANMRTALHDRNSQQLALAAHRFRGLVSNFSTAEATSLAEQVEQAGLDGDFSAAQGSYSALVVICQQLQESLGRQLHSADGAKS